MQFNEYLKLCRTNSDYTQEELVHALYSYDIEHFKGLDTTTLSKWERGITQPKLTKQVSIIKYFQNVTQMALPYLDRYSKDEIEESINRVVMQNIITDSNSKELILNFPSSSMSIDAFKIYQLKDFNMIDKVIKINTYLSKDFSHDLNKLETKDFKKWALLPDNLFLVCEYGEEVVGLLFVLKLKQEAFDKIINGTIMKKDIRDNDFALPDEKGSSYILSFFALNQKAASILIIHYYAYLITHQTTIAEVGVSTMLEDAQKLIENINLPYHGSCAMGDGMELQFFKASLPSFFATERIIKMILSKQEHEEA